MGTVSVAPGSSRLWLSANTSDPVHRGAIFGRMLLFTLEKSHHTRSDKYFSLCSKIISLGNLAIATLVDEFLKYRPWAMSDNVLVLTCSPKRGGEVGLLGGPERKTRGHAGSSSSTWSLQDLLRPSDEPARLPMQGVGLRACLGLKPTCLP